jgi:hypothetical protein
MKKVIIALSILLLSIQLVAQKKKTVVIPTVVPISTEITVPMTPENWTFQEGKVEFINHKGVASVRLNENSGDMVFKNLNFINGTIEFDVEVNKQGVFPTIYFRYQSKVESEHVYLRTGQKANAFDAVQYASVVNGVNFFYILLIYLCYHFTTTRIYFLFPQLSIAFVKIVCSDAILSIL